MAGGRETDGGKGMTSVQWLRRTQSAVATTVVLALLLGTIIGLTVQQSMLSVKRTGARDLAFSHAQRIVMRLQEAVGPAYMLAALVQQGNGRVSGFETVAAELLEAFPMARAVEMAPGGVVRQVYPLPGNESIVGHDLLKDKTRNREAHIAVSRRQLTIAGPFELLQGGVGVVGRYPVFLIDGNGRSTFWGFTIVLIRVPELLDAAGIMDISREGYRYELCRMPPDGGDCVAFARSGEARLVDPVTVPVDVPNGNWQLSVAPEDGWVSPMERVVLALSVALAALLIGVLQFVFLRSLRRAL